MYVIHLLTTKVYFLPRLFSEFTGVERTHAYQREKAFQKNTFFVLKSTFTKYFHRKLFTLGRCFRSGHTAPMASILNVTGIRDRKMCTNNSKTYKKLFQLGKQIGKYRSTFLRADFLFSLNCHEK
jgi:hypothetical protein